MEPVHLHGSLGKFLGVLERFQCGITIEGEQGAGKTRLAFIMADALAKAGFQVAFFTLETGMESEVVRGMAKMYIGAGQMGRIAFSENPADIEKACAVYDAVVIDSWQKSRLDQGDFDKLRKKYPRCILAALFQRTTSGEIRGGNMPKFDASINIEVLKGAKFEDNYAVCTKNRYAATGAKYSIERKNIIGDEE